MFFCGFGSKITISRYESSAQSSQLSLTTSNLDHCPSSGWKVARFDHEYTKCLHLRLDGRTFCMRSLYILCTKFPAQKARSSLEQALREAPQTRSVTVPASLRFICAGIPKLGKHGCLITDLRHNFGNPGVPLVGIPL